MGAAGVRGCSPAGSAAPRRPTPQWGSCSSWASWPCPLGQELLPEFKERDFLMHWVTKSDTSNEEEVRLVAAAKELQAIPASGTSDPHRSRPCWPTNPTASTSARTGSAWRSRPTTTRRWLRCRRSSTATQGSRRDVQTYLKERIREVLTGSSESIVVKVYGDDLETLRTTADKVEDVMRGVPGTIEEEVELQEEVPQVEITTDLEAAEEYGLKPGDVRRAAATWVTGEEVGDIFQAGKAYDVQVWSTPQSAQQPHRHPQAAHRHPRRPAHHPRAGGQRGDQAAAQLHPPEDVSALHRDRHQRGRCRALGPSPTTSRTSSRT